MKETPLFIPLKTAPFELFKNGSKRSEFRKFGKRWNYETCQIGRTVILSKGYGKNDRLLATIESTNQRRGTELTTIDRLQVEEIFGTLDLDLIEIRCSPVVPIWNGADRTKSLIFKREPSEDIDMLEWNFAGFDNLITGLRKAFRQGIAQALEYAIPRSKCTFAANYASAGEMADLRHATELFLDLGFSEDFLYLYRFDLSRAAQSLTMDLGAGDPEAIRRARNVAAGLLELHNMIADTCNKFSSTTTTTSATNEGA